MQPDHGSMWRYPVVRRLSNLHQFLWPDLQRTGQLLDRAPVRASIASFQACIVARPTPLILASSIWVSPRRLRCSFNLLK